LFFNEDDNENGNDNENQKINGTMNKEQNSIQNEELTLKEQLIYGAIATLAIIILMGVEGLLA